MRRNFANAIALLALFVSLGGTVYAAVKIDGKTIRKGSIPANRLKVDAVTGAQVAESALGTLPSAAKAQEAARAATAATATRATRAAVAADADRAANAITARVADRVVHAATADQALFAIDARTFAGRAPGAYRDRCQGLGTIKGFLEYDPNAFGNPILAKYNCTGGDVVVEVRQPGSYRVRFRDLNTATMALASTSGPRSSAGATRDFNADTFSVAVVSTIDAELLPEETFTIVVF